MAPWVLLFVFVAFFALFVVKIAFTNTQKIMREGERLREGYIRSMGDQQRMIDQRDEIIGARDRRIRHLEDDQQTTVAYVTSLRDRENELKDQLAEANRLNRGLMQDLTDALTTIEKQREELQLRHFGYKADDNGTPQV